jgi:hypothetical protein
MFTYELSEVCRKYGIGIGDCPTLYLMESDDYKFDYNIDPSGKLILG